MTIATRGKTADSFGNAVKRITVDRTDSAAFESAIGSAEWDVVYDNICFTQQEAEEACAIFAGRVQRYILTSSLSVYEFGPERRSESDFNPYMYPIQVEEQSEAQLQGRKALRGSGAIAESLVSGLYGPFSDRAWSG
ncbi:hypothetical protein [Paenibacillus sp. MER TA 81-3]|uniref:hypothetical protein n=1 Tax=Paenibacillus sp. MER TA 81-3 TaxID=2939573 RepID=UPI00288A38A5|nr:hypothetical protein [Paenibacillus sp. MER TA 81-3]